MSTKGPQGFSNPVRRMCRVLKVSASGYFAWRSRSPGVRQQANDHLLPAIRREFQVSWDTYGSPRIHARLMQQGVEAGRHRVARLRRAYGLVGKTPHRKRPGTTQRQPGALAAPNLLAQDFTVSRPNEKWLADHMQTKLVADALRMALGRHLPPPGLLHHSDQGSQYTSTQVRTLLAEHHVEVSMSGVGNCYDNAPMESFIGTLKTECASYPFATRAEARRVIFEYIMIWYNRQRLHSALGYLSPATFEQHYFYPLKGVR